MSYPKRGEIALTDWFHSSHWVRIAKSWQKCPVWRF